MYDLLVCPTCLEARFETLAGDPFPAVKCVKCGLGIEKVLTKDPLGAYASRTYDAARNGQTGSERWKRFHHDVAVATKRVEQLKQFLPAEKGAWLDFGCNNGAMLVAAFRHQFTPLGIEADNDTCREITDVTGHPVCLPDVMSQIAVSVATFNDVLEHLFDPTLPISRISKTLIERGILSVEVPDLDAVGEEGFEKWKHRRISEDFTEHLWHFTEKALRKMVETYAPNLKHVRTSRPAPGKLQVVWKQGRVAPRTAPQKKGDDDQ